MNKLICKKCGREILPENDKALKEKYPYYCGFCDENKYEFECIDFGVLSGIMKKKEECFLNG